MHIKRYKQIGRVAAATKLHMHYFLTLNMNYTTYFTELRWEIYKYDHVNLCDSFNLFQCPYVLLKKRGKLMFRHPGPPLQNFHRPFGQLSCKINYTREHENCS